MKTEFYSGIMKLRNTKKKTETENPSPRMAEWSIHRRRTEQYFFFQLLRHKLMWT